MGCSMPCEGQEESRHAEGGSCPRSGSNLLCDLGQPPPLSQPPPSMGPRQSHAAGVHWCETMTLTPSRDNKLFAPPPACSFLDLHSPCPDCVPPAQLSVDSGQNCPSCPSGMAPASWVQRRVSRSHSLKSGSSAGPAGHCVEVGERDWQVRVGAHDRVWSCLSRPVACGRCWKGTTWQ